MLPWNGSFLGYITKAQILDIAKFSGEVYWRLHVKDSLTSTDTTIVCRARGAQNTFPCIIDQLKELCNIPKIGTHWVRLGKRIIILSRVDSNAEFDVLVYNKLSQFDKSIYPKFADSVKKIFAFKEVFGVKYATLNSVKLVQNSLNSKSKEDGESKEFCEWEPLSVKDTHFNLSKAIIKQQMLKLWFGGNLQNVVNEIHNLLGINKQNYTKKIHILRSEIEKIIKLVDKEAISLSTSLLERIDTFY